MAIPRLGSQNKQDTGDFSVSTLIQEQAKEMQDAFTKALKNAYRESARVAYQEQADIEKKLHQLRKQNTKEAIKERERLEAELEKRQRTADARQNATEAKERAKQEKQLREMRLQANISLMGNKEQWKTLDKTEKARIKRETAHDVASKALGDTMNHLANSINNFASQFESYIKAYTQYQQKINVRLQGSGRWWQGITGIESRISNSIGITPYVRTQDVMENVVKATEAGIAFNIEQRAFLQTLSENIANTFNAFDSNLLRIIRIQQQDSTAARLGMEAGLTQFLNSRFSDTSYLNSLFDSVSGSLLQATSTMDAKQSVAFEYIVQKWLGSLTSVGFGESAISAIASGLGMLGSGDVSGLAGNTAMQNLLVMSASRAGLSYADMLKDGLDASNTNKLMKSMVEYLQEIAKSDNNVVKSQIASIFGVTVADLSSVGNLLTSDIMKIYSNSMTYGSMVGELYNQMSVPNLMSRLGIGGMTANLLENAKYSIGTGIASNPITYALWELTSMIEGVTGGIALPTFSVMGNMVDLNTTVTNLMRAGIVGVSTLGAIGEVMSGLNNTFVPSLMLLKMGITGSPTTNIRGRGLSRVKGRSVSASGYQVGASGEDISSMTIATADADAQKQLKEKTETEGSLSAIQYYLLGDFDSKMTGILSMLGSMSGYSVVESGIGEEFQWGNRKAVFATNVSVEPAKEEDKKLNPLNNINSNVETIVSLLRSIDSSIGSPGSSPANIGFNG